MKERRKNETAHELSDEIAAKFAFSTPEPTFYRVSGEARHAQKKRAVGSRMPNSHR